MEWSDSYGYMTLTEGADSGLSNTFVNMQTEYRAVTAFDSILRSSSSLLIITTVFMFGFFIMNI